MISPVKFKFDAYIIHLVNLYSKHKRMGKNFKLSKDLQQ